MSPQLYLLQFSTPFCLNNHNFIHLLFNYSVVSKLVRLNHLSINFSFLKLYICIILCYPWKEGAFWQMRIGVSRRSGKLTDRRHISQDQTTVKMIKTTVSWADRGVAAQLGMHPTKNVSNSNKYTDRAQCTLYRHGTLYPIQPGHSVPNTDRA